MRPIILVILMTLLPACPSRRHPLRRTEWKGNSCTSPAPCTLTTMLSQLVAGDIGLLKNGTYTTSLRPPANKSGTSGNPITVRAENPGSVLINGGASFQPIRSGTIMTGGLLRISTGPMELRPIVDIFGGSDNNMIRRGIFWDILPDVNGHVVGVSHGTNNTFADNVMWGIGGKTFGRISDVNTVVKRNVLLKTLSHETSTRVASIAYKTTSGSFFNNIVASDMRPGHVAYENDVMGTDHYTGWTGCDGAGLTTTNKVFGNIVYHIDGQGLGSANHLGKLGMNPGNVLPGCQITMQNRNNLFLRRNAGALSCLGVWQRWGEGHLR